MIFALNFQFFKQTICASPSTATMVNLELDKSTLEVLLEKEKKEENIIKELWEPNRLSKDEFKVFKKNRQVMFEWMLQFQMMLGFSFVSVEFAMSFMDHFLCTKRGRNYCSRDYQFQLVAMTAFYMAVKIHETVSISPVTLVSLSQGQYSELDIEEMELVMLQTLNWNVNPSTAATFVQLILDFLRQQRLDIEIDEQHADKIMSEDIIEWVLSNYELSMKYPKSAVAVAALHCTMDSFKTNTVRSIDLVHLLRDVFDEDLLLQASRLKEILNHQSLIHLGGNADIAPMDDTSFTDVTAFV